MFKKIYTTLFAVFVLLIPGNTAAHVVVRPAEVVTAGFQTFTVGAPNEKGVAFNQVKLLIPTGLKHVSPTVKPGWQIALEKEGQGEDAPVKSITWSGGSVASGFREDFTFSAQVPEEAAELQWKAYQTYADGLTVAWDVAADQQPKKADGSPDFSKSGPFSVTKVVKETEAISALKKVEEATTQSKDDARQAKYLGGVAFLLSIAGIYIASRRKA